VGPEQGGFSRALQNLAAQSSELFGVKCRFQSHEIAPINDESMMMHLYRIAQEAVSNAVKHGRAKNIRIRVAKTALTITDDGSGLLASARGEGMGLRIMRYRAEMIGGTLNLKNGRTKGVVVTCQFSRTLNHAEEN
jgi:signal transduction histidine kinase